MEGCRVGKRCLRVRFPLSLYTKLLMRCVCIGMAHDVPPKA